MSWISENYEKAALGGAAAIALGLAFAGWQKLSSVEEDFSGSPAGRGSNDPAIPGASDVNIAVSSFDLLRSWGKGADGSRPVDLFTGVPLFVNKNDPNNPVDVVKGEMVHPPIPNQWWIENRIDPGFGDSPQRDADEDGFSNIAEFEAETNPNDPREYPPIISKLSFVADEEIVWFLRPGFKGSDGGFPFEYRDTAGRAAKVGAANPVQPGALFFEKGPIRNRFKLLGSESVKQMNKRMNIEVDVVMVKVEDQKPNKKGTVYEIPSSFRKAETRKFSYSDRTAVLSLEALGLYGQEFKVEENTSFSLPPGEEVKRFKLLEITPEKIVVETTDAKGSVQLVEIAKGAIGPANP